MEKTQAPNDPFKVRITPAFSVLVGGHRDQRLHRNWYQHGEADLRERHLQQCLTETLSRLYRAADETFQRTEAVYLAQSPRLRLITGVACGTDLIARKVAEQLNIARHLLIPGEEHDSPCGNKAVAHANRAVAMGMQPPIGQKKLTQDTYSLRDDLALTFSDVLVAVWDGQEPYGIESGAGLMVRDAIKRRQCVILLHLDPHFDHPQIKLLNPDRLTDAALTGIKVMGATPAALLSLFDDIGLDDPRIDDWIDRILCPFEAATDANNAENRLFSRIGQQVSVSRFILLWLMWLASKLGLAKTRARPVGLFRWVSGSWLWLRMMLNPPTRSQPLRIIELLQTDVTGELRRHWVVHRMHGFFSGLARLDPKAAIHAITPRVGHNRYDAIRPSSETRKRHPIKEPQFEQMFNWSDEQARVYAERHRDDTWMIYYAAALAVFCAVAGALNFWPSQPDQTPYFWIFWEFVLLNFIVRRVLKSRFKDHHGHWIRFRFIAEQLRYLRLGYPLMVIPEAYATPYWRPRSENDDRVSELESAELWVIQRILIAEGIPQDRKDPVLYEMSRHNKPILEYVQEVLSEHASYYRNSFQTLQRDHHYLHRLAFVLFFLTFVVVTLHFFMHLPWSLVFTAFFPAWGAAIHGILAQNEVVRVSAMSGQVWQQLTTLRDAFALHKQVQNDYALPQTRWMRTQESRELVGAATHILSDANRYWRSLLRHNQADLPG
ncbi:MAG TPA: hypothetical protein ENM98_01725 [Halothiobacillaceae bacterium]|nr:hypothetical protein [Halothiobacillaceae bacterium]